MTRKASTEVGVGIPLTGGRLVAAARERGYPVLFSANAFARHYPKGHATSAKARSRRSACPIRSSSRA
jgi:hypothetical protein